MVFGEDLGMDTETCARIATAFGGGIAHLGLTCGAVTGALMVMGCMHGGFGEKKQATYLFVEEFVKRFKDIHGSIACTELIGHDLGDPEQLAEARAKGLFAEKCAGYVKTAVKLLEQLL